MSELNESMLLTKVQHQCKYSVNEHTQVSNYYVYLSLGGYFHRDVQVSTLSWKVYEYRGSLGSMKRAHSLSAVRGKVIKTWNYWMFSGQVVDKADGDTESEARNNSQRRYGMALSALLISWVLFCI